MTLIKSISGIRGTIGGHHGDGLTPLDVVKFSAAYAVWLKRNSNQTKCKVVVGRDARISGEMVSGLVISTLVAMGVDVVDTGLSTTPTVEMDVPFHQADGGIILTASHNPKQWNALKFLNDKGEFISAADGEELLRMLNGRTLLLLMSIKSGITIVFQIITICTLKRFWLFPWLIQKLSDPEISRWQLIVSTQLVEWWFLHYFEHWGFRKSLSFTVNPTANFRTTLNLCRNTLVIFLKR